MAAGWEEGDVRSGLAEGGRIVGMFVVERALPGGPGYIAYLRTSWKRGFHAFQTYRGKSDRVYRDLDRLVRLIRVEFEYDGPIILSRAGAPELQRLRALLPEDSGPTFVSRSVSGVELRSGAARKGS